MINNNLLLLKIVGCITTLTVVCNSEVVKPFKNGVPGSGYGCDNQCNDGDVNYVIKATLETYDITSTSAGGSIPGFLTTTPNATVSMFTRTFTGDKKAGSSEFCYNGDDGTSGPLGPCISVRPGQTMKIKVVNDMKDGMTQLKQHKTTLEEYWKLGEEGDLDSIDYFGEAPETASDMKITNTQDLPGWDATFDDVNLHLHGMQVVPHLFYPQGTGNPNAEWITIQPENENPDQQCFCYVIDVPDDHPQGTFFWHIHRHGSVAMQAWQGMVGYLLVGDRENPGSTDYELAQQGITRDEPLATWEWQVQSETRIVETDTWYEGNFLPDDDQGDIITTFLTNNEYQPTFDMCVNETIHFRLLCAQTTTGSVFYILDEDDEAVPFHVFQSDGITYDRAYEKKMLIVGPGQREGLLLQFPKSGKYRIMQLIINDFQGSGESGNQDIPAAYIQVNQFNCITGDGVDISSLRFTPGMTNNITLSEITTQISVDFQVQSIADRAPLPNFVIDGKAFDYRDIATTMNATTASEWTLTSQMNYFHPFHIHVNPFQVMQMYTPLFPGEVAGIQLKDAIKSTNLMPTGMWRDTVFIPPFGVTVIHQQFGQSKAWTGKTVYHCHFLDHEDQGMIAAMVIADPSDPSTPVSASSAPVHQGSLKSLALALFVAAIPLVF